MAHNTNKSQCSGNSRNSNQEGFKTLRDKVNRKQQLEDEARKLEREIRKDIRRLLADYLTDNEPHFLIVYNTKLVPFGKDIRWEIDGEISLIDDMSLVLIIQDETVKKIIGL